MPDTATPSTPLRSTHQPLIRLIGSKAGIGSVAWKPCALKEEENLAKLEETMKKRIAAYSLVVPGLFGSMPLLHAQGPHTFTRMGAVVGCDFTEDGWTVAFVESTPTNGSQFPVARGDACLRALAKFPPAVAKPLNFAQLGGDADEDSLAIANRLVWTIKLGKATVAVVGCRIDARGVLRTAFVSSGKTRIYSPSRRERCRDTLAALRAQGMEARHQVSASLGGDKDDRSGGLLWELKKTGSIETVQCDLDEDRNLITKHLESSDAGIVASEQGRHCLDTLRRRAGLGLKASAPLPVPRAKGEDTTDPGCLVWVLDGGVVLE